MEIGAYVTGMSWLTRPEVWTWQQLKSAWLEVESLGYDYCWTMDNVVGALPFEPEVAVFDTWTILGAIADATHRNKFGTMVTPYGRRRPAVIAKSSSVLDVISNGRFQLGRLDPGVENACFAFGQAQVTLEFAVGNQIEAGHTGTSKINGHPVRFLVPDGG